MFVKYFEDKAAQSSSSENDQANNYFLILEGEKHSYNEIFKGYADTYYDQIKTIGDAKITDIKLSENGQMANVTATFKPIDSSSELEPVGDARDKAFGGLDNDTIMRNSKSGNVLAITIMIQLKLYSVYYGDMGKIVNKAPEGNYEKRPIYAIKNSRKIIFVNYFSIFMISFIFYIIYVVVRTTPNVLTEVYKSISSSQLITAVLVLLVIIYFCLLYPFTILWIRQLPLYQKIFHRQFFF